MAISKKEKAQVMVRFPEVLNTVANNNYKEAKKWALSNGIMMTRDDFSAGGRDELNLDGKTCEVPRVILETKECKNEIRQALEELDPYKSYEQNRDDFIKAISSEIAESTIVGEANKDDVINSILSDLY